MRFIGLAALAAIMLATSATTAYAETKILPEPTEKKPSLGHGLYRENLL